MSFEENILLKIRREFSGNEKYRLFLKHLDSIENQLRKESQQVTELLKKNAELKKENGQLRYDNQKLQAELGEYTATDTSKNYVRMKAYRKLEQAKVMWETRFWELHKQLELLKQQISDNEKEPSP